MGEGPSIVLDKPILVVGRHPDCDVMIDSKKVSRRHCCLAMVNGTLVVRDLGSTNGVRINGQRVDEGRVKIGDEVTIANISYKLQRGDASEPGKLDSVAAPEAAPKAMPSPDDDDDDILIMPED
jgi:pSer/pThr/pTyr-binding forkhead associated (FHA) protein